MHDAIFLISCAAGGFTDTYCAYPNKTSPRPLAEVTLHAQLTLKRISPRSTQRNAKKNLRVLRG